VSVFDQTISNVNMLKYLLDLGLTLGTLELLDGVLEEGLVGGKARVFRNTVVVLAGQKTGSERRPDGGTVLVLVVQRSILDLETLSVEGIVLRLLSDGSDQVVLLGNLSGFHDLSSRPLGGTPYRQHSQQKSPLQERGSSLTVVGQVEVTDRLGETLDNLLHGSCGVGTVSQDDINVVVVQSLEGALQALDDVLLGKTTSVGLLAASTEEDLG
jgi:hypothetical protein